MSDLTDRVVLVTGAAGGIGQALCRAFAAAGMRVGVCDINRAGTHRMPAPTESPPNSGPTARSPSRATSPTHFPANERWPPSPATSAPSTPSSTTPDWAWALSARII